VRTLQELLNDDEPAWPMVQQWIKDAKSVVEVLDATEIERARALLATQVTTRSPMGAVVYETGGIFVDHGWLRVLGSGHSRLPRSLPEWNRQCIGFGTGTDAGYFLVADDVMGGLFAVNGGGLPGEKGELAYFAPDTLEWMPTRLRYSDFLVWCLSGKLSGYYKDYRWEGWETEVQAVGGDKAYSIAPPPIVQGEPFPRRSRRPISVKELFDFYQDLSRQMADVPDGARVIFRKGSPPQTS
jgi:hypothetical protein